MLEKRVKTEETKQRSELWDLMSVSLTGRSKELHTLWAGSTTDFTSHAERFSWGSEVSEILKTSFCKYCSALDLPLVCWSWLLLSPLTMINHVLTSLLAFWHKTVEDKEKQDLKNSVLCDKVYTKKYYFGTTEDTKNGHTMRLIPFKYFKLKTSFLIRFQFRMLNVCYIQ